MKKNHALIAAESFELHIYVNMYHCAKKRRFINDLYVYTHMSSGQNDVKFNAMHKLGSSRLLWVVRISVFPEVSQMGYRYRVVPLLVMKVSWNLGKAKVKQDEISITIMLSITHIYI